MTETRNQYPFEKSGSHRDGAQSDVTRILLARLGLTEKHVADPEHERIVRLYVVEVPLNIQWYEENLETRTRRYHGFIFLSVLLLVAITPLVAVLPMIALEDKLAGGTTAAQVTGLLAGLFAVQRAFGVVLDDRKRIALYHEASAELKEMLYSLEEQWRRCSVVGEKNDEKIAPDLVKALREDVKAARAIVREERKKNFENMQAAPTLKIGEIFKQTAHEAKSITDPAIQAGASAAELSPRKAREKVAEQRALVAALGELVAKATEEYEAAKGDAALEADAAQHLKAMKKDLCTAQVELAKLEACLH